MSVWSLLFWSSLFALTASYFLYPLILWVLTWRREDRGWAQTLEPGSEPMVWLVVAAYNEEKVIEAKLENLLALDYPAARLRFAIVSDGSTDATCARARAYLAQRTPEEQDRVSLIERPERSGKTVALSAEIENLVGDIVVFSDANTMYDSDAVMRLVVPFGDPSIGLVCGNLQYHRPESGGAFGELLYWRYENLLKRLEGTLGRLVVSNGSIYAIRLSDFEPVPGRVADDMAVPLTIAAAGKLRVYAEKAIARESLPQRTTEEFRAKARIVAQGLEAIRMYRHKIAKAGTVLAVQLFLRKVLRWFAVPIMAMMLIASIFGEEPILHTMLVLQVGFYGLAVFGEVWPKSLPGLLRIPAYYCMVSSAAFRGFLDFRRGQTYATWEKSETVRSQVALERSGELRVLFLTHYFPPEGNAPASRVFEMARRWVRAGHRVRVITCAPNVPNGKVYPGYENRLSFEELEGIDVVRVRTFLAANRGVVLRTVNYVSYMLAATYRALVVEKPDIVVATSPQFFCGWAGVIASAVLRVPFLLEIRDIWPDSIEAVGAIRNPYLLSILKWLERRMYARADRVVTVSDGCFDILVRKGVPAEKIRVVTNGVDPDVFPVQDRDVARKQFGLGSDQFVCSYVGTIGLACGLEVVLDAAKTLKVQGNKDVVFLIAGDGETRTELEAGARDLGLDNVRFLGRLPKADVPPVLSASDCCLVHLRASELFQSALPSKMFEAMAMARPVILGVEGEARELVVSAGAGVGMEPENSADLVEAILQLQSDESLRESLGQSGVELVETRFNREILAMDYLTLLQECVTT